MTKPFVSLHVHSEYSLLDGLSKVKDLVKRAKELNHPAIALTDHGVMHGSVELYRSGLDESVKPIIGCEAYLKDFGITSRLKEFSGDGDYRVKDRYHQLILAQNAIGYKNLCKLTSIAHLGEGRGAKISTAETSTKHKGWITLSELEQYSEGLIITSGCMAGIIPQCLRAGSHDLADQMVEWYKSRFGDRFYIEIQDHAANDGSRELNLQLVELAQKHQVSIVATADNHYTSPCDKSAHDALLCINTKKLLSDEKRMRYEGAYWLPTGDEMLERLSAYLPYEVALEAVENTVRLAERVEDYQLKRKPTPPKFIWLNGFDSPDDYLEDLAYTGLRDRFYGVPPQNYVERLQEELDVFKEKDLAEYFLVVGDICRFCREQGIWIGAGRGSAAGSLVSYALRITNIDPIHFGLIFSRFINVERMSYPDIDLDIDKERRHEVVEYLAQKYGSTQVAQIATFNKMVSASALKDTGRVLNVNYGAANELSRLIPVVRGKPAKISEMIKDREIYPEFYDAYQVDQKMPDKDRVENISFRQWIDIAIAIEGTVKAVGVHAAGVVIGWQPLDEIIPLMKAKDGGAVSQYAMEDLEYLGLLKMDLLGLKTLSVMRKTVESIERMTGEVIDVESINLNDQHVLRSLVVGDSAGIFQFEADGAARLLKQINPTSFKDVYNITSINRPGCLDMNMHIDYAKRKAGLEPVSFLVPELKPILGYTYGLCIFQEQMLEIFNKLAGFSLGKADSARRACGKKKKAEMLLLKADFIEGCNSNWIEDYISEQLFEIMLASAEYTFNLSHAACYSIITIITAWLKHYYQAAFMAALMSAEEDSDKLTNYLLKARSYGITLFEPNINRSQKDFTCIDEETILWGLRAIAGVGDTALNAILLERQFNGYFESWIDFVNRVNLGSDVLVALIKSGALDCLGLNRRQMTEHIELLREWKKQTNSREKRIKTWEQKASELNVEGSTDIKTVEAKLKQLDKICNTITELKEPLPFPAIPDLPEYTLTENLKGEKEVLGLYASGHPLDAYKVGCNPFHEVVKNKLFISSVLVSSVREANSKSGKMAYVTIEDKEGATMTLKVFNAQWTLYRSILKPDAILSITAKAQEWQGRLELILQVALLPTKNKPEPIAEDDDF